MDETSGGRDTHSRESSRRVLGRALHILARPVVRLTLLVVLLAFGATAVVVVGGPSRAGVERFVQEAGIMGPVAYVLLYAVLTVALVPGSVITAAGGVLFGAFAATGLTVVGATAGGAAAFAFARWLGRAQVDALTGGRTERVDRWLERRGFVAVLYLRLVPLFPFNVSNYVLGVTAVRARDYVVATAIGIVPGTFAFAALGGNIDDPTSPQFLAAAGLLVVLAVGGPMVQRWLGRRGCAPRHARADLATNRRDAADATEGETCVSAR